jgi:alpha,alpha-trehalase
MHRLEMTIARLARADGDHGDADAFEQRAAKRRSAVDRFLWSDAQGAYFDYDWRGRSRRDCLTAAAVVPLFTGMASQRQAEALADTFSRRMLAPGGLATTELVSTEQWDRPNGWAPLQWMAANGFAAYGLHALARDIRARWLQTVQKVYAREGKLVEKYALREVPEQDAAGGGGGEYPLQDGFGWTNGVTRCWLEDSGTDAPALVEAAVHAAS